jgi:hypothetical protein
MLYTFGFERIAVVVGDLHEDGEHGVWLELRALGGQGSPPGGQPIWRVDLLESAAGPPGSLDRAHYHPEFTGRDPGPRVFSRELSADPLGWLGGKLAGLDAVLMRAGFPARTAGPGDAADLRRAAPQIVDVTGRLLSRVRSGELGLGPRGQTCRAAGAAGGHRAWPNRGYRVIRAGRI